MRLSRTTRLAAAFLLAGTLASCGDAGSDETEGADVEVAEDTDFPQGSTMAELSNAGEITIGVKYDQPGIGFKSAASDVPEGFDIEMAKYVAGALGIPEDGITWEETITDNREPYLMQGVVDLVAASYSITPERQKVVGQAGPYFVTGQQLLVRKDNDTIEGPEDVQGKEICSVTGSTSIDTIEKEYGAKARGFSTYSECVEQVLNGSFDAMTTDGTILLGYAAENPDELEVVGPEFSEENIGFGYPDPDDTEMCEFLSDTIQESYADGSWEKAFNATLGQAGVEAPEPPKVQPCK
ncbi:MAG: glutamate transporter substrate-binding protein [Nocardioidaceae bacterium]|jgi:glutamate transport system substrate-binding protein|nr:glutamate transporter substrate-binding protein [Nocardioidaceae bacterium]